MLFGHLAVKGTWAALWDHDVLIDDLYLFQLLLKVLSRGLRMNDTSQLGILLICYVNQRFMSLLHYTPLLFGLIPKWRARLMPLSSTGRRRSLRTWLLRFFLFTCLARAWLMRSLLHGSGSSRKRFVWELAWDFKVEITEEAILPTCCRRLALRFLSRCLLWRRLSWQSLRTLLFHASLCSKLWRPLWLSLCGR